MCGTLPLKITQSLEFLHFGIPGLALLEACRLGVVGFAQPRTVPVYDGINFELVWDGAAGMTFAQLAQKHDCSPSTIRWHLLDEEERQNWRAQKNRNGHHKRSAPVLATTGPARDTEANPGKPEKKKSEKRQGNGHRAQGQGLQSELQAFLDDHWMRMTLGEKVRCVVGFLD